MNEQIKQSWLLRKRKRLRFLSRFRTFILRNAYLLGDRIANFTISLGYLVKNSAFFKQAKTETNSSRIEYYERIARDHNLRSEEITYLEFGVYQGDSFAYWLAENQNQDSRFFGFDTFSGLPEDWGHIPKGHFDTKGLIPSFDDNRYSFSKGLFQETIPSFLTENLQIRDRRLLINFDADLYSSTLYALVKIADFLKPGDILLFDELFSIVNASTEFRAFIDFLSICDINVEVVAKTTTHCALKVT